ncbi:hypothetical protein D3C72_1950960 [compost metagenome]
MQRDEPEVRQTGLQYWRIRQVRVGPLDKSRDLRLKPVCRRRFKMDALAPVGAGHDLHRPLGIVTPCSDT